MSIATAILGLSPLGVFHTASSLIAIAAGFVSLARHAAISTTTLSHNRPARRAAWTDGRAISSIPRP